MITPQNKAIQEIPLKSILLDAYNPRFGKGDFNDNTSQPEILNFIVKNFGVDDVLSSLAVNGYFSAEPIVCRRKNDSYVVLEGNRRVAAMLILSGDERAASHKERKEKYQELHRNSGIPTFDPVPAIVFEEGEDSRQLLSYLGVRHIVSTKDWDSFAKAHWVYNTVAENDLSLDDIATMTGDNHQTIRKLLQGHNFVKQLEREKLFIPENSNKSGRGSKVDYPFSWVYTILGYRQVKDFVGLSDNPIEENPIPNDSLENAALLLQAMFGDKSKGRDSQVGDSRNLSALASAVTTKEKVRLLKEGKHVNSIEDETKPIDERLSSIFYGIRQLLAEAIDRIVRENLEKNKIPELIDELDQLKRQFKSVEVNLKQQYSDNKSEDW